MNHVLWNILFFITLSITIVFFAFGIYEYIAGPAKAKQLLRKMHIPLRRGQITRFFCRIRCSL